MRNGNTEPSGSWPIFTVIHSRRTPSGRVRPLEIGSPTGILRERYNATSASILVERSAQAHTPASVFMNSDQACCEALLPGVGAINSRYDPSAKPIKALCV